MKRRYTLAFLLLCILPVLCPAQRTEIPAGVNPSSDSLHRTVAPNPPSDPDSLRLSRIDSELAALVGRDSTFRREVDVTSGRLSLSELLRNIARASGVNVSVRGVENIPVSCNFRRARVDDLVRFLCREYRLDAAASGNILSIFPAAAPTAPAPDPDVAYAAADTTLTYDLRGERLIDVAKKIARLSARNVIVPEPLYDCKVSGYVRRMPFDEALRTLAAVNGLLAERDAQDVWTLWREEPAAQGGKMSAGPAYMRRRQFTPNELRVDSLGRITARIARGNVQDVILDLCDELELNYYFQSPVNLTAGVWVDGTDFETLLSVLLKGSPYSYYTERGIWIFGAAASDGLSSATVLPLVYRSVSKVEEIIPEALKQNVAVKTFPDLNALILSGDRRDVARVETFLRSVDKPVPMVTMEILIADVTKSKIHEIGVGAGVGDKAVKTSGTLSPGVDMTFGANAVNDLLGRIRGTVNLGRVTPNFYLSLQALEEDGVVRLLSTPKLSTLNGHEATLTSGETQYYKEVQNNYYGTQNPISSESYQWKSVDANLSIKVTPYVSEDRQITLEIEFEQYGVHRPHCRGRSARHGHAELQVDRQGAERGDGASRRAGSQHDGALLARCAVSGACARHQVVLRQGEAQQGRTYAQYLHQTHGRRMRLKSIRSHDPHCTGDGRESNDGSNARSGCAKQRSLSCPLSKNRRSIPAEVPCGHFRLHLFV